MTKENGYSKVQKGKEVIVKEVRINVSAYARDNGISWPTAKKRILGNDKRKKREFKGTSKLEPYIQTIDYKLENFRCSAVSIYWLIKEKGYKGSSSLVTKYVQKKKENLLRVATIRVESTPGLQAQVDWKETMTLYDVHNESYTVNIFLYIMSYSKHKYIELTIDRSQPTLFKCLVNCFRYTGGVPEEIWFDNMKTVVDHHDINTNKVDFNERFLQFSRNCLFKPIACRPYRPCTKGLAENLAKVMDRLKAYNNEFEGYDGLKEIVTRLNHQLNYEERSQATNEFPYVLFEKEKEYLTKVNLDQFDYSSSRQVRKVTNESMIYYEGHKYSVPVEYLGELVEVETVDNVLHIYYSGQHIRKHNLSDQRFNYEENDLKQIIRSSFPSYSDSQIEAMAKRRLEGFDILLNRKDKTNG